MLPSYCLLSSPRTGWFASLADSACRKQWTGLPLSSGCLTRTAMYAHVMHKSRTRAQEVADSASWSENERQAPCCFCVMGKHSAAKTAPNHTPIWIHLWHFLPTWTERIHLAAIAMWSYIVGCSETNQMQIKAWPDGPSKARSWFSGDDMQTQTLLQDQADCAAVRAC